MSHNSSPLHISFSQAGILLVTMGLLICFLSWRKMTWHQHLFRNTRRPVDAFIRVRNFTLLTQTELTGLQSLQRLCGVSKSGLSVLFIKNRAACLLTHHTALLGWNWLHPLCPTLAPTQVSSGWRNSFPPPSSYLPVTVSPVTLGCKFCLCFSGRLRSRFGGT